MSAVQLMLEHPRGWLSATQISAADGLTVTGWAVAEGGIERIEIAVDGRVAAVTQARIARADVMTALAGREDALRSGFEVCIRGDALPPGEHAIEVRAFDRAGASAQAEARVQVIGDAKRTSRRRPKASPAKARALFIDAATPTPDKDAGSNVAIQHMRILQALGYAVTFVPAETLSYAGRYTQALEDLGIEVVCEPQVHSLEELLRKRGGEFDVAYVHRYTVGEIAIGLLRQHAPRATILFNNADLHYLRMEREAAVTASKPQRVSAARVKARELAVIAASDHTILCNSVELDLLRRELPDAKLHYLPWVIDVASRTPKDFAKRAGIMFLGGFGHAPNVDAADHLVREVMPLLRERLAGVRLHLYGSNASAIERLAAPDVVIEGHVADLDQAFKRHRLSVAPLRFGAGFKGKLAESLSRGVPAVATSIAIEGTGLSADSELLVADDPVRFADSVARLYRDGRLWSRLSQQGRRFVRDHYSFREGQRALAAILGVEAPAP